jgi:hypothetical protein
MKTNIYILIDPETLEIRYVGKANDINQRYRAHLNRARKHQTHKLNWINSLKKKKLKPIIEVIDEVPIEEWHFWEKYWISQIKTWGFNLTNYCGGGEGSTFGNKTSFKKGNKPWNDGLANIKNCVICNKSFQSCKSESKSTCSKKCSSIVRSKATKSTQFSKNHVSWIKGIKGIKLKPDKTVYQYCIYTGNFIKEWKTAKEASLNLIVNELGIGNACRGTAKSAGGFMWKYYKEEKIEIMNNIKLKIKKI